MCVWGGGGGGEGELPYRSATDHIQTTPTKNLGSFDLPYFGIGISGIVVKLVSNLESFLCKYSLTHDNLRAISYSSNS